MDFGGSEISICRWQSSCIVATFMSVPVCFLMRCSVRGDVGLPSLGEVGQSELGIRKFFLKTTEGVQ